MAKMTRLNVSRPSPADGAKDRRIAELEALVKQSQSTATEALNALQALSDAQLQHDEKFRQLQSDIDRAYAARDAARNAEADRRGEAAVARQAEKETRAQFAELKENLHFAEMKIARLEGYIDRVAEDDAAREEPRVVESQRIEPRRPPRMQAYFGGAAGGAMTAAGNRPRHWTGY